MLVTETVHSTVTVPCNCGPSTTATKPHYSVPTYHSTSKYSVPTSHGTPTYSLPTSHPHTSAPTTSGYGVPTTSAQPTTSTSSSSPPSYTTASPTTTTSTPPSTTTTEGGWPKGGYPTGKVEVYGNVGNSVLWQDAAGNIKTNTTGGISPEAYALAPLPLSPQALTSRPHADGSRRTTPSASSSVPLRSPGMTPSSFRPKPTPTPVTSATNKRTCDRCRNIRSTDRYVALPLVVYEEKGELM